MPSKNEMSWSEKCRTHSPVIPLRGRIVDDVALDWPRIM